jgi:hypothetical protein
MKGDAARTIEEQAERPLYLGGTPTELADLIAEARGRARRAGDADPTAAAIYYLALVLEAR